MTSDNPEQRRVGIYFGPTANTVLTKDEVAEFIKNEMGLVRSDGGPKWTEGLTTLIEVGMSEWEDYSVIDGPGLQERINDLEETVEDYHREVKESRPEQETDNSVGLVEAAERVHRTEARILEVLCRDRNIGAKSPNYVEIHSLAEDVGLEYPVVYHFVENLVQPPCAKFVTFDLHGEKVKATSEDAFERYCEARRLDADSIGS